MKYLFDEIRLRLEYLVESCKLRYGLDRDDPLVDTNRRQVVAVIGLVVVLVASGAVWLRSTVVPMAPETVSPAPSRATDHSASSTQPASLSSPDVGATRQSSRAGSTGCSPHYSPCVPDSASDLNCADIGFSVQVIDTDVYGLDADADGTGCDSYQ